VQRESSGNQDASNGVDDSYYQWLPSTWQHAQRVAGVWFTPNPFEATLVQQTIVFNAFEPTDPGAWPETVPACGGP
jgi:hypothetical protein